MLPNKNGKIGKSYTSKVVFPLKSKPFDIYISKTEAYGHEGKLIVGC